MPRNPLTYDDIYEGLPILPEPDTGNYLDILGAIRRVMEDMIDRHCRVFGVLFGLNLPWGSGIVPDNHHLEAFMDAFTRYLRERGIGYHFVWIREQPAADSQPHWHILLLMDGDRTWSFYGGHLETATRLWADTLGVPVGDGLVHLCEWSEAFTPTHADVGNGGVMVRRNDPSFGQAYKLLFHRASYLSKAITKQFTPKNLRRFSASHLR